MQEIRQIIQLYDELKAEEVACALAVVVSVEQSSYRRVGARLLVSEDGRYVGGISGGCLEGDALRRARRAILAGKPSTHVYDTVDGEDAVIGIGLGCEGRIEVLFLPLAFTQADNEIETLRQLVTTRTPRLITRLLKADGPPMTMGYQPRTEDQLEELGKALEHPLPEVGRSILAEGRSKVVEIINGAGRKQVVYFEVLQPNIHLVVTGTNYDIPATLIAARNLGWHTTVVGAQRKFTSQISRLADQILDYSQVDEVSLDAATAVVLMSHDYDWDRKMVQHFLPRQPAYFGMLGPRKRVKKMADSLKEESRLDLLSYPKLYSPVGLDIGAETPPEIAASLIAEIVMAFRGRSGGALRNRRGSIH